MLRLLVFAPCEKVVIGQDQLASIISIMERVIINAPLNLPPDAVTPMRWSVITLWRRIQNAPEGVPFSQKVELFRPNEDQPFGGGEVKFVVSNEHNNYRTITELHIFPVGLQGEMHIRLFLKNESEGDQWIETAEYPLEIVREPINEAAAPAVEAV